MRPLLVERGDLRDGVIREICGTSRKEPEPGKREGLETSTPSQPTSQARGEYGNGT